MKVLKYSGELELFDPARLKSSLSKSGASRAEVERVWKEMQPELYDGMATKEIYQLAFARLKKSADAYAARYSLKRALVDLGPGGYLFEKWIARMFGSTGHQTITSRLLDGHAVTHEIDVIAYKEEHTRLVECKFRNTEAAKIDVRTPMYLLSRFKDIQGINFALFKKEVRFTEVWLATNVQLTKDAIRFAEYYGMRLISWNYPAEGSIKYRVDNAGLYPLTCLTTLSEGEKALLMKQDCIMVKELLQRSDFLDLFRGMTEARRKSILKEATELVEYTITATG